MDNSNLNPEQKTEPSKEGTIPENAFLTMAGTQAIPINQLHVTIGRSHDNTLVLDDPRVSRRHMEIRVIRDHFVLFDLNSSGGTYVNGQKVSQGILYTGDVISLAGVSLVFMQDTRLRVPGTDPFANQGPGDRNTAIFNPSTDKEKKGRGWW